MCSGHEGVAQGQWRHTQSWNDWGHGEGWLGERGFGIWFRPSGSPIGTGCTECHILTCMTMDMTLSPGYYSADYYGEPSGTVSDVVPAEPAIAAESASLGEQYAEQARESFRDGDYRQALRLAQHAAIDMPRDPAVHELMSLVLFALKDYRGAAIEAHAALALGPPIDWPTLYAYYGNADTYTA